MDLEPVLATQDRATGFVYHGKFEPKTYLNLLDDNKVNVLCCTPTEYRLMAKVEDLSQYNLEALHSAVSAGEPLNRSHWNVPKALSYYSERRLWANGKYITCWCNERDGY